MSYPGSSLLDVYSWEVPIDYLIPEPYRLSHQYPITPDCSCLAVRYRYQDGVADSIVERWSLTHHPAQEEEDAGDKEELKQCLMQCLLGDAANSQTLGPVARTLTAPTADEEVHSRIHNGMCDFTAIPTASLLVRMVSLVLSNGNRHRSFEPITKIDLSHTSLGPVGPSGPPTEFDRDGNPVPSPRTMRFFPDERIPFRKTPPKIRQEIALRSLAAAYISPLLYLDSGPGYHVEELVCQHAQLTDHDATAMANILLEKTCTLRQLDLSHNSITDKGAKALCSALKRNKRLTALDLSGNEGVKEKKTIQSIRRRLLRNAEREAEI